MVGYSINERLGNGFAMGHHSKVAGHFPGGYALMLRETCRLLGGEGISLINIQQDLGEPGLEMAKRLYRPYSYLYKYQISRRLEDATPFTTSDVLNLPSSNWSDSGWMDEAHVG
jgi:hypothetical protein